MQKELLACGITEEGTLLPIEERSSDSSACSSPMLSPLHSPLHSPMASARRGIAGISLGQTAGCAMLPPSATLSPRSPPLQPLVPGEGMRRNGSEQMFVLEE